MYLYSRVEERKCGTNHNKNCLAIDCCDCDRAKSFHRSVWQGLIIIRAYYGLSSIRKATDRKLDNDYFPLNTCTPEQNLYPNSNFYDVLLTVQRNEAKAEI